MSKNGFAIFMATILTILAFYIGLIVGALSREKQLEEGAVKANHAEYYLDEKHERQWRWKDFHAPSPH